MIEAFGSSHIGARSCNAGNGVLKELQQLWREIGETEADKDRMLVEIEQECLEIYKRKFDEATNVRTRLQHSIATKEAEAAKLVASLGDANGNFQVLPHKKAYSLRAQLDSITPLVEELNLKKEERVKQFADVKLQIERIADEISGYGHVVGSMNSLNVDEDDLSLRKLREYQCNLHALQKVKSERLQKIMDYVNEVHALSSAMGLDFVRIVDDVHPSLRQPGMEITTNISDTTLEGLDQAVQRLKTERKNRFQQLKDAASSLSELWTLMDVPREEKIHFLKITSILNLSESEIVQPAALSEGVIEQVSTEVERLTKLKASRLRELVTKKRSELEEICHEIHILPDPSSAADKHNALIESGLVDPCEILANIEAQIQVAKHEASSRKEINAKIDRWLAACEEEKWLEDYNQDQNRYNAGRGSHINLKRAERARILTSKLPAMIDNLMMKTLAWEADKQKHFLYDGVRFVSILEDYKRARQLKEEEKKRARDQKKLHDLLLAEKESMRGSKPSPRRLKPNGYSSCGTGFATPSPRRNSAGSELLTPRSYSGRQNGHFKQMRRLSTAPLNFVPVAKEDTISFSSVYGSEPESPSL